MRDLDAELTCALQHVTDPEVVPGATSRRLLELTLRAVADDRTRQDAEIARLQHELFAWRNTATLAQNEEKSLRHELAEARALAGEAFMALTCVEETCIRFNDLRGRLHEFYSTSDQPGAVKPCADCGEPTDVWHDGTHLCWKCRA